MSRKLALIIGNSDYQDPLLARLITPPGDAQDLAEVLRAPEIGGFDEVATLINQPAPAVRRAISLFFNHKQTDDLVLLYFSGHGVRDDSGLLYLAVQDTEHDLLDATAIPAAFVTDGMNRSRSQRQVLILDCCHSGAFAHGAKGAPGLSVGTAAAFEGTGYGRIVLTATDATQYAWQGDELMGQAEHSIFTHFLVEGLRTGAADTDRDGRVTLDEWYEYASEHVARVTPKQTPGRWSYKLRGKAIEIARSPVPAVKPSSLSPELDDAIRDRRPWVREGAVRELERLLNNSDWATAAREALLAIAEHDDSATVKAAAASVLGASPTTTGVSSEAAALDKPTGQAARVEQDSSEQNVVEKQPQADQRAEANRLADESFRVKPAEAVPLRQPIVPESNVAAQASPKRARKRSSAAFAGALALAMVCLCGVILGGVWAANNWPAILAGLSTKPAALPPAIQRIAFESDQDGNYELYVMKADGTAHTRLTNNSATDAGAAWSSDGSRIAFSSNRDGNFEIYMMAADGAAQTRLTNSPGEDVSPAWSPDGSRIAFQSNRDGHSEIYLMTADGAAQTRLTNDADGNGSPAWSPDGSRIAFTAFRVGGGEIYVMKVDGSARTQLTNNSTDDGSPSWSPDGSQIAFYSDRDFNREIFVMQADGSAQTRLTNEEAADESPAWSPDGSRIAFESVRAGNRAIYVMNTDGSVQTRLTDSSLFSYSPAWQP